MPLFMTLLVCVTLMLLGALVIMSVTFLIMLPIVTFLNKKYPTLPSASIARYYTHQDVVAAQHADKMLAQGGEIEFDDEGGFIIKSH